MDEDLAKHVKDLADSVRARGDSRSLQSEMMATIQTKAYAPIMHFIQECKKISRGFFETALCGTIESLLLSNTDSIDEALNLLEKVRQNIISMDNEVRKHGRGD